MIRLVRPTLEYKSKALEYRQEHFDNGENIINGSELLDKTENYEEWLKSVKDFGNSGYSVRPSQRQKGYATEMLRQVLDVARGAGLKELHLSVEKENLPSVKTIVKNGGVYERSFEFEGEQADIYKIEL